MKTVLNRKPAVSGYLKANCSVRLASNTMLINVIQAKRQWIVIRNLPFSRREKMSDIEQTIYKFHELGGTILMPDGNTLWPIPMIYESMGGHEGRWLSYYEQANFLGEPSRTIKTIERLNCH